MRGLRRETALASSASLLGLVLSIAPLLRVHLMGLVRRPPQWRGDLIGVSAGLFEPIAEFPAALGPPLPPADIHFGRFTRHPVFVQHVQMLAELRHRVRLHMIRAGS